MSPLKYETTKKGQVNKFLEQKFEVGEDKQYMIEAIRDGGIYNKSSEYALLGLSYLVF